MCRGDFYKDATKKDGLHSSCKRCNALLKREYYYNNREELIRKSVDRSRGCEKARARKLKYSRSEKGKEVARKYRINNKPKPRSLTEDQLRKIAESKRKWREKNRDKINEKARSTHRVKPSPDKIKEYKKREYYKMKNDPYLKYVHYSRVRLGAILKQRSGTFSVSGNILFNKQELVSHLEGLMQKGMSWDNYGRKGWHIDHIIPISSFDLTKEDQVRLALGLENLQPLWWFDNLKKGATIEKKKS